MRIVGYLFSIVFCFFLVENGIAQPGMIIESGDQVLDPNQDGFVSLSNSGFIVDNFDVDEFEIKMFGIPIFGDGEALNDVQSGQPCGVVDIALDTAGYGIYAAYDNNQNLIFRFRLAGDKKSVQSYSILIDTDELVGAADPNSSAVNPGFEIEITLIQKFGVYIYGIDGSESCPTPLIAYDVDTHQQKATSSQQSCGDPDIYIDFYVPFSDLTALFGITPGTNLRFAGVTNISATCALDGSISDIGGVDDIAYDGCFSCAVLDLTENQCPSSVSNLCDVCAGFPLGATETPDIDLPVIVGDINISGTSEPDAEIYIGLYSDLGVLIDQDTTTSDIVGTWQSSDFVTTLNFGDSVIVNALLAGKCESGLSDTGLSFAIVSPNQPPELVGSALTITYIENETPIIISNDITIIDDNSTLISALVSISDNYQAGSDVLGASPPPGITSSFDAGTGILSLSGNASLSDYDSALRSITYYNSSEAPSREIRTISFSVNDGLNQSQAFNKSILITQLNDPPIIIIGSNPVDTIFTSTEEDVPLPICIDAQDIDLDQLAISSAMVIGSMGEVVLDQGLCLLFTPEADFNGLAYLEVIVCDNGIPALCDTVVVEINITPVNDAPKILLNGVQTDSLFFRIEEGSTLDFCLNAVDLENNDLIVESIVLTSATTSSIEWQSGLCFKYTPEAGFLGFDTAEIVICDDGSPSRCTVVYLELEVLDINLPPQITTTTADTLFVDVFKNNTIEVCLDAIDPDNDPLDFSTVTEVLGIGGAVLADYSCINYTPPENFVGTVLLNVNVCDNIIPPECDKIVLSINVLPFNNPPQVVVDSSPVDTVLFTTDINTPLDLCLDVIDSDNDNVVTTNAVTDNGDGTFTIDGTLCIGFVPGTDNTGQVWGTITVCDDGDPQGCTQTVVGVTILPKNDPPSILLNGEPVDTLYLETTINKEVEICLEASDTNGDDLEINGIDEIQPGGFFKPGSSPLCLGYVPLTDFVGESLHIITICDNGTPQGCDSVYIKTTVRSVNSPPILSLNGNSMDTIKVSTDENVPIEICLEKSDIDGDAVSLSELLLFSGEGDLTSTENNSQLCLTYSPAFNYFGKSNIKVSVCDDGLPSQCTEVIIEVEVVDTNTPPQFVQNGIVTDTLRFSTLARTDLAECIEAIDQDGDEISLTVNALIGTNGAVALGAGDLCFLYSPESDFIGLDYFTLTICDDQDISLCSTVVVEIDVFSNNLAPKIKFDGQEVDTVTIDGSEEIPSELSFSVEDNPADNLFLSSSGQASGSGVLNIILNSNTLLFGYTPDLLSNGEHLINFKVCDDGLPILCDSVVVQLEVARQEVFPFQAISPNGDRLNDFWIIQGIEHFPDNSVIIFDRWNNTIFTASGYNNNDVVWRGESNKGVSKKDVENGTYYYKLTLSPGGEVLSGMVVLKR